MKIEFLGWVETVGRLDELPGADAGVQFGMFDREAGRERSFSLSTTREVACDAGKILGKKAKITIIVEETA